jgi:excisionase family DNA binding protein
VNLKTAARRLGVHYQTAYRWVRSGQLVAVKVGSGYEISEAALTRFQVQRAAIERVPDLDESRAPRAATTAEDAVALLDAMLERVTVDARPVAERTARLVAEVLGDAAVVYGLDEAGHSTVLHVAHHDPVCEVTASTVARHGDPGSFFARAALRDAEPLFIPQVPQRNVRRRLRAEVQQHMGVVGCYSALSVPIVVDGHPVAALVASRDTPTRPYTREDLDFVRELAGRLESAYALAARCRGAWALRERIVDALRSAGDELGEAAMLDVVASDHAVAVLDLDLRHVAVTDAYATMLGVDRASLVSTALAPRATNDDEVRDSLARLLFGELDYCEVPVVPASPAGTPAMLHVAMVREADATPRYVVVIAQEMPVVAPKVVAIPRA